MSNNDWLKKVENFYDSRMEKTDDAVFAAGQWEIPELVPQICDEICRKTKITKNHFVLELGCGSGVLGNWISKNSANYVGIDISSNMLNSFNNSSGENSVELLQGITDKIPFNDNIFDVIVMNSVTMYIHDNEILLNTFKEMQRVAKNNGILFIGDNITPSNSLWELVWYRNLSDSKKSLLLPYIKFRKWLANKNKKFAGKWKVIHKEISPKLISNFFNNTGIVSESMAATYTIKKSKAGTNYKGSKRVDFVIQLNKE